MTNIDMKKKTRNVVLTFFTEELEELKHRLESYATIQNCIYYMGNPEKTENEKIHTHVLLCFKYPRSLGSIHTNFMGVHIEPCMYKQAYIDYLSKEDTKVNRMKGFYATNYVEPDPSSLPQVTDIYTMFMEDLDNGYTKKQLMRKYPSLFIRHFDNITKLINDYYSEE